MRINAVIAWLWIALTFTTVDAQAQKLDIATTSKLRILSYNIKHGQGNDGVVDLDRSADVIMKAEPDFVGLQEVDNAAKRSGSIDQAAELGERLKMHHAFGKFMDFQGGEYGLAVLSKFPIVDTKSVELPAGGEPRVVLAARVKLPGDRHLMLINVHFDWVSSDRVRFRQAQVLCEYLRELKLPYILLGDFNDRPQSRTLELIHELATEFNKPEVDRFTFSSSEPRMEIDFVFASPASAWKPLEVRVLDEPIVSDHRPVLAIAEIQWPISN